MLETTVWSLTHVILLKQRDGSNGLLVDFTKTDKVTLKCFYSLLQKNDMTGSSILNGNQ